MTTVRDLMTTDLQTLTADASVADAARMMRDAQIGDVLVCDESGGLTGILTDRDIAIRMVAEGKDPDACCVGDICSGDLTTAAPDDDAGEVVQRMRREAIRRVPVVEGGRAVGILSIGDLAIHLDDDSVLAAISAAPADR